MSDVGIYLILLVLLLLLFGTKVGDVGKSMSKSNRKRKSLTREHR
jgi:Sec-independent protein translocase protein TatA